LARLLTAAIDRCRLDLAGAVVLTEAATGAYAVTPVLAALAGAPCVHAVTRTTRYGSAEEITQHTLDLARLAGADPARIRIATAKTSEIVGQADIVTNSGHVRPINAEMVGWMKPTAVVPLMYEAWEFRPDDLDVAACRERNIWVAGTNERHPAVDVFSYLGIMAVKLLLDAGVAVYGSRVLLLCDNPFRSFLELGLSRAGAAVDSVKDLAATADSAGFDAILVAMKPRSEPVLSGADVTTIARKWPGAVVAHYWGDLDRAALEQSGVPCWPMQAPPAGHMGILPSGVGPEPIVRLQCGGLKVGELLWRARRQVASCDEAVGLPETRDYCQPLSED
jgi:hypothetical protein